MKICIVNIQAQCGLTEVGPAKLRDPKRKQLSSTPIFVLGGGVTIAISFLEGTFLDLDFA